MHRKANLNMRKNFTMQVTMYWSRLAREIVEAPSLEILQNHLNTVLVHVLWDDPA